MNGKREKKKDETEKIKAEKTDIKTRKRKDEFRAEENLQNLFSSPPDNF